MAHPEPAEVTLYLERIGGGDESAVAELLPHVYDDLRGLAENVFRDQWRNHTLQPTVLVHEAYLRLAKPAGAGWENKRHFLRVAALAMRQLLTDYARANNAQKRMGGKQKIAIEDMDESGEELTTEGQIDLVELDSALGELRALNERQAEIVELRFLTGLSVQETADVLDVSERTVYLDWNMARAWLERRLST